MGIYIPNMKIPKYTTKAEFGIDADGNPLCMVYHEDGTEPDIYDVVPLPEGHGRLIDADALKRRAEKGTDEHGKPCMLIKYGYVNTMPTILEAEGGGKDG